MGKAPPQFSACEAIRGRCYLLRKERGSPFYPCFNVLSHQKERNENVDRSASERQRNVHVSSKMEGNNVHVNA